MRVCTTCASCGEQLDVEHHRQITHLGCPPSPRSADQLEAAFLAAAAEDDPAAQAEADRLAWALDFLDRRAPNLLDAALAYAAWGWPVFPCRPHHKRPLLARTDGGHGLHDATTDPRQLTDWWGRTPTANVGLRTGVAFDVLDVDPAGLPTWAAIRAADLPIDIHGVAGTPRGGLHIYLLPGGGGNLARLHPGLDFRGAGGYVLAPPSELGPAAIKGPVPRWPLRYRWHSYPSPALTGGVGR